MVRGCGGLWVWRCVGFGGLWHGGLRVWQFVGLVVCMCGSAHVFFD